MADPFILAFSTNWYFFLLFGALVALVCTHIRKSYEGALKFGLVGLVFCIAIEFLGAALLDLWTYTGGNWPIVLWASYFVFSVAWYQMVRALEKVKFL